MSSLRVHGPKYSRVKHRIGSWQPYAEYRPQRLPVLYRDEELCKKILLCKGVENSCRQILHRAFTSDRRPPTEHIQAMFKKLSLQGLGNCFPPLKTITEHVKVKQFTKTAPEDLLESHIEQMSVYNVTFEKYRQAYYKQ